MTKKLKDIVAKVGEYEDRSTGRTKARWKTVGALMEDREGNPFIILERTFNPAGLPNPDGRESCLLSCFEPNRDGPRTSDNGGSSGSSSGGSSADKNLDDDIPF